MNSINLNHYEYGDIKIQVGKMYRHKHVNDYCVVTNIVKRQIKKSEYHDVYYFVVSAGLEFLVTLQSFPKYYKEYIGEEYAHPSSISSNSH